MPERKDSTKAALFAAAYVAENCNGARAMKRIGHTGSPAVREVAAHRLLRNVQVQDELRKIREEAAMGAVEVLARHAEIARATVDDFLDADGRFDIKKARRAKKLHLLREMKVETEMRPGKGDDEGMVVTRTTFKLHDAQAAQRTIMQHHALLTDVLAVRDLPKDERELDALIEHHLKRVMGPERAEIVLKSLREPVVH